MIHGAGWGTLFLGLGVMAIAPIRAHGRPELGLAVVLGALLALWGGSDVVTSSNIELPHRPPDRAAADRAARDLHRQRSQAVAPEPAASCRVRRPGEVTRPAD